MKPQTSQVSDDVVSPAMQRERLQILVSAALRTSAAALDGFTRRLGSALTEASLHMQDEAASAGLHQAAEHLSRERNAFQRLFFDRLQQELEQETQALLAKPRKRLRDDALDLSLTSLDAMQCKVAIDNHAQAFDRVNAERLGILQMRLTHWLDRDEPSLRNPSLRNPFRAEVFMQAAVDAWSRFETHKAARDVLLQQLSPTSFLALDMVLAAIDQELVVREVLPQAERRYRRLAQSNGIPATSLLHAEQRALERAGEVFDHAFAYLTCTGLLPVHAREQILAVRSPLRRLALAAPRFLRSPRHPGRCLLQAIVHASLTSDPAADSGITLQALVERVASGLEKEAPPEKLEAALHEFEAFLTRTLQVMDAKRDERIAEAVRQENEERASQLARRDVSARLEGGSIPDFIDRFLSVQWTEVITFARRVHANKPELIENLAQAMDDLIWSVQPKTGMAERETLEARLPALLVLLNAWLNLVKWTGSERETFFAELAARHAAVLNPPVQPDARAGLEERMNEAQRASEHDLSRRAAEQEEDALSYYMHQIDKQAPGDWAEFVRNDGSTVNCRLAWISPARTRLVFVAPKTQLVFSIAATTLAQGLRGGRTRFIVSGELFATALSAAVSEVGAATAS